VIAGHELLRCPSVARPAAAPTLISNKISAEEAGRKDHCSKCEKSDRTND
jgi:hypothetical protein